MIPTMRDTIAPMDAEKLKQILRYDPQTGEFVWLVSTRNGVSAGDVAGYRMKLGYKQIKINGENYRAHRLAWLYMTGNWPSKFIDHIDGNPFNNKFENLREASTEINRQNQRKAASNNVSSGLLGVSWHKKTNKWRASVQTKGKRLHLGYFDCKLEAHEKYLETKRLMHEGCTI